jgi:hypothetical protein
MLRPFFISQRAPPRVERLHPRAESLSAEGVNSVAPEVGFEPTTNRLTADRSTTELLRIVLTGGGI